MSFVITLPEMLMAAVGRLEAIGSAVSTANVTAALPIAGVIPAAADEVSMVTAASFTAYGQLYQAISAEAHLIHEQFVKALGLSANSYAATEAANATHAGGGSTSGVPMQPVPVGPSPSSPAPDRPSPTSPAPRPAPDRMPARPMPDRMPTHSTPAEPASTTPYREGYGGYGHGAYGGYGQGGYGGHGQGGYSHGAYGGHGGYGGYSHGAYGGYGAHHATHGGYGHHSGAYGRDSYAGAH